jgi:hypothetical protein
MIYITGVVSLVIQFLVGFFDFMVINKNVGPNDEFLRDLLKVELVVQIVEFMFYVWLFYFFHRVSKNITPFRYLDWSITTPLMLITLSGFLQHTGTEPYRLGDFISKHAGPVVKIVLLNAAMLFFGFIGELGFLNRYLSTALGFVPFIFNFKHIKDTFLPSSAGGVKNALFYLSLFIWSLYGVFALTSYTVKNTGYNILDIFSKNFFGLFLGYIVWSKSR